jgi:hypothetical protein
MDGDDYDDISKVRFQDHSPKDKEIQSSNDRLIMKYFGSKLKDTNKHPVMKNENFEKPDPKWAFVKPVALSAVVTALAVISQWPSVSNMLSFTSQPTINTMIPYGLFFIVTLVCIYITYTPWE